MGDNNKIVYSALKRTTDDREAIKQAFLSWHGKFANAELDVFAFVDHIEGFLGLSTAEKKVLMMSMHAASSTSQDTLQNVPEYIFSSSDSVAPVVSSESSENKVDVKPPCVALSEIYFNRMMAGVQRMGNKYKVELVEVLDDEALPDASQELTRALRNLDGIDINLPKTMSEPECKSLCHEMYMLVCDIVGPTSADDISYRAVNSMLEASESSRYDPRDLI